MAGDPGRQESARESPSGLSLTVYFLRDDK